MTMSETRRAQPYPENENLIDYLEGNKNLPGLPAIALRIIELSQDSVAGLSDIADVVNVDPILTHKILRLANSPSYARQRKIDNLRQAIMLFGLDGTLTMALGFSMVSEMCAGRNANLDYGHFWRRSLISAAACRIVGSQLNVASSADLFLAGLLQDIGMLALDKTFPGLYRGLGELQGDHGHVQTLETKLLGVDHAVIGAWLLKHWNLPQHWLQAVISGSHDPLATDIDAECRRLAQCVVVSAATADIWCGKDFKQATRRAAEWARTLLGMNPHGYASILRQLTREFQDISMIFNVNMGDTRSIQTILDQTMKPLMVNHPQRSEKGAERHTPIAPSGTLGIESLEPMGLNRIYDRDHFARVFNEEFSSAREHDWPLAIVIIDLDHSWDLDQSHANRGSDRLLEDVVRLLCGQIRDTDCVSHCGERRFVVLLPGTGLEGARVVGRRIVDAFQVSEHQIGAGASGAASVGVAVQEQCIKFSKSQDLAKAAAQAVSLAKQKDRHRIVFFNDDPTIHQRNSDPRKTAGAGRSGLV